MSIAFPLESRDASPGPGGTQVATFPAYNKGRMIDRVNITGPANSHAVLYVGGLNSSFQRDGTNSGAGDTAEYPQGLYVPPGHAVYLVWDTVGPPTANAVVQWRLADGVS